MAEEQLNSDQEAPPALKGEKVAVFYVQHSRSSSSSSRCHSGEEKEVEAGRPPKRRRCACLCKVSGLFYLVGCVLVSALYVAVYGQSQQYFAASTEEVWVPGKPTQKPSSSPSTLFFDSPYTEWVAQRWTFHDSPFSNWPSLPSYVDTIQQVAQGSLGAKKGVWVLTSSLLLFARGFGSDPGAVVFVNCSEGLEVVGGSRIASGQGGELYVVTPSNVTLLDCSHSDGCVISARNSAPLDLQQVHSVVVSLEDGRLWVGTERGLYEAVKVHNELSVYNSSNVVGAVTSLAWRTAVSDGQKHASRKAIFFDPHVCNGKQAAIAHSSLAGSACSGNVKHLPQLFGLLVVGTKDRLYFHDGTAWWFEWVSVWYNGQGGVVDGPPSWMTFTTSGELFISNNVSVSRLNINYTIDRIGPLQGLPYNHVNALFHSPYTTSYPTPTMPNTLDNEQGGTLWIGTGKGYALFDISSSEFRGYFYGPRWHPGESVLGFASGGGNVTVVLTNRGISVVQQEEWTLQEKASHYQDMLARHTRAPGLVADCSLTDYVPDTCAPHTTDNDGLWTSWLVAAEAFRYQATGDPEAKANAWKLFRGMQFLVNATGISGLPARSVVRGNVSVSGDWHNSTSEPGWKWKGDTSSDEIVGHMFAYPLVYDLVAENIEEKTEAAHLLDSVVGYIKENQYYLIDVTNRSTRWGVWNPDPINSNQSWSDEHGVNSLQILSYLLSAYHITGRGSYLTAWMDLADGSYEGLHPHYGLNMVNQKITFPRDDNFSDDELAFLPYFVYFHALKQLNQHSLARLDPRANNYGTLSLQRAWRVVGREKSSAWTAIYSYAMDLQKDPELLESLVWNLRTWPLELVEWMTNNSHRLDIRFNPEQDRNFQSHSQSVDVLPANERSQLRWNSNPYQLDYSGSSSEMDPGAWLMPYWFARWMGML